MSILTEVDVRVHCIFCHLLASTAVRRNACLVQFSFYGFICLCVLLIVCCVILNELLFRCATIGPAAPVQQQRFNTGKKKSIGSCSLL